MLETDEKSKVFKGGYRPRAVFSMGAIGALAPAILKDRLLAPTIFGHFSTVGKNCGCYNQCY